MTATKRAMIWTSLCLVSGGIIGWSIRVTLDVLATRTGWHVGGEALVLLAMPICWAVGRWMRWG